MSVESATSDATVADKGGVLDAEMAFVCIVCAQGRGVRRMRRKRRSDSEATAMPRAGAVACNQIHE